MHEKGRKAPNRGPLASLTHMGGLLDLNEYVLVGEVIKPRALPRVFTLNAELAYRNPLMYDPADHPEMLTAFIELGKEGKEGFLEYVNAWGPLGYQSDMDLKSIKRPPVDGEPVSYYELHHFRLSWLAETMTQVSKGNATPDWLISVSEEMNDELAGIRMKLQWVPSASGRDIEEYRKYGILPKPTVAGLRMNLSWVAPVHVLYWHLARWAIGVTDIGKCEECRRYFVRTRKDQRFCPPKHQEFVARKQSKCGVRRRVRKKRASGMIAKVVGGV